MKKMQDLTVKLFADGADKKSMLEMHSQPHIEGLTTNPTLIKKAGVTDYKAFCLDVLQHIMDKPISFEVVADDFAEMEQQALEIASWGENVYAKIPITNTQQDSTIPLIKRLVAQQVKVNVTAIMTLAQVRDVALALDPVIPSYVSIFAGRIADTGRDPLPLMAAAVELLKIAPASELIWASCREVFNIFQADQIGCHIITLPSDILKKLSLFGYDLDAYSLDTVKIFYHDAQEAGFTIGCTEHA